MENNRGLSLKHALTLPFVWQLLIIMFVTEYVKGALLVSILPLYMGTVLGLSTAVIGLAFSLQYLGDNLFRSPLGMLMDKVGYRYSMMAGLLIAFSAVILIVLSDNSFGIVLGCAMLGIGTSPLWPCVLSGVTEIVGEGAKATIMSTVHIAWLSGTGLGPITMNLITGGNYVIPFRLIIIATGAVTLLAFLLPNHVNVEFTPNTTTKRKGWKKWFRGEEIRRYFHEISHSIHVSKWFFPVLFLQTFSIGLLAPVVTLYARSVLGLTGWQYSVLLLIGGGITVSLLFPVGRWVDRYGGRWCLIGGFALGGVNLLLFTTVTLLWVLFLVVSLIGIAYALIIPAWNAFMAAAVPSEKRGAVWGFYLTINGMGMVTGPVISGWIWDRFGPSAPFYASGSVLLLLLIVHIFALKEKRIVVR